MSDPVAPAPQAQAPQQPVIIQQVAPARKPMSGMAVTALVLGIVAIATCYIPVINNGSIVLGALAVVFGVIGLLGSRKTKAQRGFGLAVAGLVTGLVAVILALVLQAQWSASLDDLSKQLDDATSTSAPAPADLKPFEF